MKNNIRHSCFRHFFGYAPIEGFRESGRFHFKNYPFMCNTYILYRGFLSQTICTANIRANLQPIAKLISVLKLNDQTEKNGKSIKEWRSILVTFNMFNMKSCSGKITFAKNVRQVFRKTFLQQSTYMQKFFFANDALPNNSFIKFTFNTKNHIIQ